MKESIVEDELWLLTAARTSATCPNDALALNFFFSSKISASSVFSRDEEPGRFSG
jgi:hypothetical protein